MCVVAHIGSGTATTHASVAGNTEDTIDNCMSDESPKISNQYFLPKGVWLDGFRRFGQHHEPLQSQTSRDAGDSKLLRLCQERRAWGRACGIVLIFLHPWDVQCTERTLSSIDSMKQAKLEHGTCCEECPGKPHIGELHTYQRELLRVIVRCNYWHG